MKKVITKELVKRMEKCKTPQEAVMMFHEKMQENEIDFNSDIASEMFGQLDKIIDDDERLCNIVRAVANKDLEAVDNRDVIDIGKAFLYAISEYIDIISTKEGRKEFAEYFLS